MRTTFLTKRQVSPAAQRSRLPECPQESGLRSHLLQAPCLIDEKTGSSKWKDCPKFTQWTSGLAGLGSTGDIYGWGWALLTNHIGSRERRHSYLCCYPLRFLAQEVVTASWESEEAGTYIWTARSWKQVILLSKPEILSLPMSIIWMLFL